MKKSKQSPIFVNIHKRFTVVLHDIFNAIYWVHDYHIYNRPKIIVCYCCFVTRLCGCLTWKSPQAWSWYYIIEDARNNDGSIWAPCWKPRWIKTEDRQSEVYLQNGFAALSHRPSALLWHRFPYRINWDILMSNSHDIVTFSHLPAPTDQRVLQKHRTQQHNSRASARQTECLCWIPDRGRICPEFHWEVVVAESLNYFLMSGRTI